MKNLGAIESFECLPDSAGISLRTWALVSERSRASTYRDIKAGRLESFKIGNSTRLRVGSCRKVLQGGT